MNKFILSAIFGLLIPCISFAGSPKIAMTYIYKNGATFSNATPASLALLEAQAKTDQDVKTFLDHVNSIAAAVTLPETPEYLLTPECDFTQEHHECLYWLETKCPNGNWGAITRSTLGDSIEIIKGELTFKLAENTKAACEDPDMKPYERTDAQRPSRQD
jgi:hypothetical protein